MTDWHDFRARGLRYNDTLFDPEEVPGDGNCFFHSLARSGLLGLRDGEQVRRAYLHALCEMSRTPLGLDVQYVLNMGRVPLTFPDYVAAMSPDR
jgi:hypothetical protein